MIFKYVPYLQNNYFSPTKDYKLLAGSNQLWPNVAYGDPLPAISDCCVIPQWVDTSYLLQTCVPPPPPEIIDPLGKSSKVFKFIEMIIDIHKDYIDSFKIALIVNLGKSIDLCLEQLCG